MTERQEEFLKRPGALQLWEALVKLQVNTRCHKITVTTSEARMLIPGGRRGQAFLYFKGMHSLGMGICNDGEFTVNREMCFEYAYTKLTQNIAKVTSNKIKKEEAYDFFKYTANSREILKTITDDTITNSVPERRNRS